MDDRLTGSEVVADKTYLNFQSPLATISGQATEI